MSIRQQVRSLVGGTEPPSANAYLAFVGVVGALAWVATEAINLGITFRVAALGWAGAVTVGWILVTLGFGLLARDQPTGVTASVPMLTWAVVMTLAFSLTAVGLVLGDTTPGRALMWAPWALAYAVGYLVTGYLVSRGTVYLAFGLLSGALFALVFVFPDGQPGVFTAFAVLHAVPMLVDAARGGRELTAEGLPAIDAAG